LKLLALAFVSFVLLLAYAQDKPSAARNRTPISTYDLKPVKPSLHGRMQQLWEDQVSWMRNYIISAAADLPDKDVVAERLMRNQEQIGSFMKPFYGVGAGDKLTALLKEHIRISTEVVAAAKAGDAAKQGEAAARWNKNADDIAAFLSKANPKNWQLDEMRTLMHEHLQLTSDETAARMGGHYGDDIAAHDKVHRQILKLADKLSTGIADQFPDKATARP